MFRVVGRRLDHVIQTLTLPCVLLLGQRLSILQDQARHRAIFAFDDITNLGALFIHNLHAIPQVGILVMKRYQLVYSRSVSP